MQHRKVALSVSLRLRMLWGSMLGTKTKSLGPILFLHLFIGFGMVRDHGKTAAQDIHGLNIKMVVNGDFASGANGEEPKTVFGGIFGPSLGEPLNPNVFNGIRFSPVRKCLYLRSFSRPLHFLRSLTLLHNSRFRPYRCIHFKVNYNTPKMNRKMDELCL